MAKFEAALYNTEVRKKLEAGERHRRFTNNWADMHYIEIEANNEEYARAKIEVMHPRVQGFVLDYIVRIDWD